jgi:hypothetical protein
VREPLLPRKKSKEKEKEKEAMGARRRGLDDKGDHDDARNRLATWPLEVKSWCRKGFQVANRTNRLATWPEGGERVGGIGGIGGLRLTRGHARGYNPPPGLAGLAGWQEGRRIGTGAFGGVTGQGGGPFARPAADQRRPRFGQMVAGRSLPARPVADSGRRHRLCSLAALGGCISVLAR